MMELVNARMTRLSGADQIDTSFFFLRQHVSSCAVRSFSSSSSSARGRPSLMQS